MQTASRTEAESGNPWWSADITSPFVTAHIKLKAESNNDEEIKVNLYKDNQHAGRCADHPGDDTMRTLSCDRVEVDKVELSLVAAQISWLTVFEILVFSVLKGKYFHMPKIQMLKLL